MGIFSRLFAKESPPRLSEIHEAFATSMPLLKVDLWENFSAFCLARMEPEVARTIAAQVVNFLVGEDIDEIARVSEEPLRSRITAILPQVRQTAAACMQADRQTREIIVATLRVMAILNFGTGGPAWFETPANKRIEQLLVEYGPEFPDEITSTAYL